MKKSTVTRDGGRNHSASSMQSRSSRPGTVRMRRRDVLTLLGGAAAWTLPCARAIAVDAGHRVSWPGIARSLCQSPQGLPRRSGRKRICGGSQCRDRVSLGGGPYDRLPALAADLVDRKVAVIAAPGGAPVALAAKSATDAITIVFEMGGDPVALGVVDSLSRPGGNLTGVSSLSVEVSRKRLEFMHELLPSAAVFAVVVNPTSPTATSQLKNLHAAAGHPRRAASCSARQHRTRIRRRVHSPSRSCGRRDSSSPPTPTSPTAASSLLRWLFAMPCLRSPNLATSPLRAA